MAQGLPSQTTAFGTPLREMGGKRESMQQDQTTISGWLSAKALAAALLYCIRMIVMAVVAQKLKLSLRKEVSITMFILHIFQVLAPQQEDLPFRGHVRRLLPSLWIAELHIQERWALRARGIVIPVAHIQSLARSIYMPTPLL